jgi:hypothetical protein
VAQDDLIEALDEALADQPSVADQRSTKDRRSGKPSNYCGPERRRSRDRRVLRDRRTGDDRRAGFDRRLDLRRKEDQATFQKRVEEGDLTLEEIEFVRAIDRYKQKFNRPFPTWSEVLALVKELGYTKDSLS